MRGLLPHLPDETMNPERMRVRTRGRDEMARHAYTRDHTAWDFKNGLPRLFSGRRWMLCIHIFFGGKSY